MQSCDAGNGNGNGNNNAQIIIQNDPTFLTCPPCERLPHWRACACSPLLSEAGAFALQLACCLTLNFADVDEAAQEPARGKQA